MINYIHFELISVLIQSFKLIPIGSYKHCAFKDSPDMVPGLQGLPDVHKLLIKTQ